MTFGRKTVVFGGDFRKILPLLPKGTRQEIVGATLNSSYLWSSCKVLKLTKNLRLQSLASSNDFQDLYDFSKWVANIGDGKIGGKNDGFADVVILTDNLLKYNAYQNSSILDSTFLKFSKYACNSEYFNGRSILAPTLDVVDQINEYMSERNESIGKTYLSCYSACKLDAGRDTLGDIHTPEFLNGLKCSGLPNHSLTLKVGTPIMLLRNIYHSFGLCNGMRLIVSRLADHLLEASILSGSHAREIVLTPRMSITPSDPRLLLKFQRKQFPIMVSYAMTINKRQGQTLSNVGFFCS